MDDARMQQVTSEGEILKAKLLQARAATEIKLKEAQIDAIKTQVDLAKKEKNDIAKSEHESRKRLAELEKNLLQRRESLRSKEIEFYEAKRELAKAQAEAAEAELALVNKRQQRAAFGGRSATPEVVSALMKIDSEMDELERKTLEAQIKAAERNKNVAAKEVDLAKNRKRVLEAQIKLMRGA
jgi:hypothetical protein